MDAYPTANPAGQARWQQANTYGHALSLPRWRVVRQTQAFRFRRARMTCGTPDGNTMFVLNVLQGESRPNNEAKFANAESLKRVLRKGFPNRTFNMPRT